MVKRIIILVLILVGVSVLWKTQKEEANVYPDTQKEQELENSEKTGEKEEEKKEEPKTEEPKETEKEVTPPEEEKKEVVIPPVKKVEIKEPPRVELAPKVEAVPARETKVKVYFYEWNIDLSQKEIPSGTVVFEVLNTGKFTHDFAIRGKQNYGKVKPGESRVFSVKLGTGDYKLYSDRGRDDENGMVESFMVVR